MNYLKNVVYFVISYLLSYLSLNILFEYFLIPVKMGEGILYS